MIKLKIFISSVQSEFSDERQKLNDYISSDALLGRFFEPFIFEQVPASGDNQVKAYLDQVKQSDIYLGIFGQFYGNEDIKGISPVEHEFNLASSENKTKLIFVSHHNSNDRHPKEKLLIRKAEEEVVRKGFSSASELKTAVYSSLVNYLAEKEYLRIAPFDASVCGDVPMDDIDHEKISLFIELAQAKRGFPLPVSTSAEKTLTHLHLLDKGRPTNAALLLFAFQPQKYFISAEIKCAQFHGNSIQKPIPAFQVYKGDIFQQINQAVDFVLSRINVSTGSRDSGVEAPVNYEIPRTAVIEAIVNAVAHRDYNSTAGVQVMLFRNRLEVWNPGQLPLSLSLSKLKKPHSSFPANPLIAEPLYLSGYIERLGTGIPDMINSCLKAGLKEPEFKQEDVFKAILWRKKSATGQATGEATGEATGQVTGQATEQATVEATGEATGEASEVVRRIALVLKGEMKRVEIQKQLQLRHDENFRINYILPALAAGYVEMSIPDTPTSPKQHYLLTAKGIALQKKLIKQQKGKK